VGIALANWNWQVVRQCIAARCGPRLGRSACTRSLHRPGFAYKRPKKRLLKADEAKRAAFVQGDVALLAEARAAGAQVFFVDEAHFRADGDLRGKWVLKGQPTLVDSTCPRRGEQASDYSAVCLETGEVEHLALAGTSSSATSATFLRQLRVNHAGPLVIIRDNGPAHGGEAVREYLATPALGLRLVRLPAYSPDCNPDEALRAWAREEVTANTGLSTKAEVQEKVNYPRLKPEACSHGGSPCYVQEASCPAIPIRLAERLLTSGRRPYSRREPERRSTARVRCGGVALGLAHRPMLPRDWREASRERGPSATGLLYHFLSTDARNGTLFIVAGSAPHAPPG